MYVRLTTNPASPPASLGDFGITSGPSPTVSVSEFTYRMGSEIYGEGEPADYVYQVKSGAVQSYKLLSDGRRQIGAFHLPGDIFGLEHGGPHRFTAEAIVDTTVRFVNRKTLEIMADSDVVVARALLNIMSSNLSHVEDHLLLLGRQNSLERVAAFLVEMDDRLTANGVMELPMTRRDIADYLGLTVETVSRPISKFYKEGLLEFVGNTQREIVVRNRQQLAMFGPKKANTSFRRCLASNSKVV